MAVAKSKPILRRRHRHQSRSSPRVKSQCLSLSDLLTSPLYILDLVISSGFTPCCSSSRSMESTSAYSFSATQQVR